MSNKAMNDIIKHIDSVICKMYEDANFSKKEGLKLRFGIEVAEDIKEYAMNLLCKDGKS